MQVSADQALSFYRRLEASQQAPSLHPAYVLADAQRSASLIPRFFVYQAGEHFYYHAFQMEGVPGADFFDIQSPYGYGGAVATTTAPAFLQNAWAAYSDWCRSNNVLVEFIRFHPLLENWRYFSGEVLDDRQTVWLDLSLSDPMTGYATRVRTAVRKAAKNGLRVEWCDTTSFMAVFPALYEETMRTLDADDFYLFPTAYYEQLTGSELAKLAICRDDHNIYAGAILLTGPEMVEYHLSASNSAGKALGATNLLLHEAVLWARQSGKKRLHLGGGTNADPENRLLFFKAGFSDRRAPFKIGKKVHQPDAYAALRADWESRTRHRGNRILFYR
jgi:hypothetical protein